MTACIGRSLERMQRARTEFERQSSRGSLARASTIPFWGIALLLSVLGPARLCAAIPRMPSIEIGREPQVGTRRPISLDDILSIRELSEPVLSPDGSRVAFLVRQAFVACNCSRAALYVGSSTDSSDVRKLDEEPTIAELRWAPDGRHISFLSARGGSMQLWWVDADGGTPTRILMHAANGAGALFANAALATQRPIGVASYEWSPDGHFVAFSTVKPADASERRQAISQGFRYDDSRMNVHDLNSRQWVSAKRVAQLWLYDMRTRAQRLVWQAPEGALARIGAMAWAPDSGRIAISFRAAASQSDDAAAVIDISTRRAEKLLIATGSIEAMAWAPDARAIAALSHPSESSYSQLGVIRPGNPGSRLLTKWLTPAPAQSLIWDLDRVYFESGGLGSARTNGGIYAVADTGGAARRITGTASKVSDCSVAVHHEVACVWQSPSHPPRVAILDLATHTVRLLGDINPQLRSVQLGPVEELHWKNGFGDVTNGYLVLPPGPRTDSQRLPLVVIAYGFDGDFVAQANWTLTSYPAQALARDGIAVLLINAPRWSDWSGDDFARGSRAWGYGPLSALETIVQRLGSEGLVDTKRVGFMGHSWGGFWVQFAVSHSDLLRAVEIHNGGTDTEPGSYSITGSESVRAVQSHFMGGGPYPPTLRNYLGFSAALTADHVKAPVLIELNASDAFMEMEYYTALKSHDVPVDMIIYPDDLHVFVTPSHRLASMRRNLDWFEFWLQGRVRKGDDGDGRYALWMRMRTTLRATSGR